MEPILSNVAGPSIRNEPRDLLSRLYREIGISAVAAALAVANEPPTRTAREKRAELHKSAA